MSNPCVIIGVAGGSGSGKTTVARRIVEGLTPGHVPIIGQDSYYKDLKHLSLEDRMKVDFDHPHSLDNDLLCEHLRELRAGRAVNVPVYDYAAHTRREETVRVEPARVIVVEGILVLVDPELRELMDIRIFVRVDPDIRFIRRLQRDVLERGRTVESVIRQYRDTVRPAHLNYVEPSMLHADIIIPKGGHNEIAIDMVRTKVGAILAS